MTSWQLIGEILQHQAGLSGADLSRALAVQAQSKEQLGVILLQQKCINAADLGRALAFQYNLSFMEVISIDDLDLSLLNLVPIAFSKENRLLPLHRKDGAILVAAANPLAHDSLNDLVSLTGEMVVAVVATPREITRGINLGYESRADKQPEVVVDMGGSQNNEFDPVLEPADLLDTLDEAPVIRFVNSLVTRAYRQRASDIHLEPFENELIIRYRIDGILYEVSRPSMQAHASITSRIKIMAELDIAEKRLPQDGRFRVRIAGKDVDVRVSTIPTAFGERLVLRLLDKSSSVLCLEDIGLADSLLKPIHQMINQSHGVFLVTGPTGSGKTTTLYAALSRLNTREKNIITVEDPIEYQLAGVGQMQVNPKINLTFANGLRSILRQDPDVIMIGEIRDSETAEIAVQSALTGHIVFSTLHTNDAAGALTRLVEMGIEPFLTASAVTGVLGQRLVRTICPHCRQATKPSSELLEEIGGSLSSAAGEIITYYGVGCEQCMHIGYRGRTGIYELLVVDDTIRELILKKSDSATIREASIRHGMTSLREAGLAKALAGLTTLEEVLRVTQEES